jgi:PPOX class probable F420-dependent enzyme
MTETEALDFLKEGTRTAKLATVQADGRPHVTPIWFVIDDGDLVFNTWHTGVKARNIRRDPRVALVVDLEEPPYAFVIVEGTAQISTDLSAIRDVAERIGGRYMGEARAEEFGERNGVEGELLIRVRVDRIIAGADVSA